MKSLNQAIALLIPTLFAINTSAATNPPEDPTCKQEIRALAKALAFAGFQNDGKVSELTYEGADEEFHYTISVQGKPITWSDGHLGPISMKYEVSLDNDSPEECSVINISLPN